MRHVLAAAGARRRGPRTAAACAGAALRRRLVVLGRRAPLAPRRASGGEVGDLGVGVAIGVDHAAEIVAVAQLAVAHGEADRLAFVGLEGDRVLEPGRGGAVLAGVERVPAERLRAVGRFRGDDDVGEAAHPGLVRRRRPLAGQAVGDDLDIDAAQAVVVLGAVVGERLGFVVLMQVAQAR